MSDRFGNKFGEVQETRAACHVAYTLNNKQPVRCTIIGDQPLFYMDYECDYEDEDLADAAEMRILENEIQTLKNEIDNFDRFSKEFPRNPQKRHAEFLEDKAALGRPCAPQAHGADVLKETIAKSRLGAAYIEFAQKHGVEIKSSDQVETAFYDRRAGQILVNANLPEAEKILLTTRELRRHWQHRHGVLIHPLTFQPDNAILVNRLQVADLVVSMIRTAWELQLSGYKEAWERIEISSMADLGRAFAREAFMDFRTLNNGQAAAAVFESWFLSERCRTEDKKLIQQMLADYQGYVFDMEKTGNAITPALIAALGEMPFGKNYLAAHASALTQDPIFTDVRDRSNANFLWFIKFERSFRETEQELQSTFSHAAGGVRQPALNNEVQGHEKSMQGARSADIIPLSGEETVSGGKRSRGKRLLGDESSKKHPTTSGGAEIIYLRRWSKE